MPHGRTLWMTHHTQFSSSIFRDEPELYSTKSASACRKCNSASSKHFCSFRCRWSSSRSFPKMSDTLCVVGTPLNATNNSSSENITYSITPVIALNQLNLTSADNAFRQEVLEYNHDIRFLPNETVDAVRNLMASAVAGWVSL